MSSHDDTSAFHPKIKALCGFLQELVVMNRSFSVSQCKLCSFCTVSVRLGSYCWGILHKHTFDSSCENWENVNTDLATFSCNLQGVRFSQVVLGEVSAKVLGPIHPLLQLWMVSFCSDGPTGKESKTEISEFQRKSHRPLCLECLKAIALQ